MKRIFQAINFFKWQMCVSTLLIASVAVLFSAAALAQAVQAKKPTLPVNPAQPLQPVEGDLIIKPHLTPKKAPLFFTAKIWQTVDISPNKVNQKVFLRLVKLQGDDKVMSLQLSRKVDGIKVEGAELKEWAIREHDGKIFLDITAKNPKVKLFDLVLHCQHEIKMPDLQLLTLAPAEAIETAGFSETITMNWKTGTYVKVTKAKGCIAAKREPINSVKYLAEGASEVWLKIVKDQSLVSNVDIRELQLNATLTADGKSAIVDLTGNLHVREVDQKKFTLLKGRLALIGFKAINGLSLHIENGTDYQFTPTEVGVFPIRVRFAVAVNDLAGWQTLKFSVPQGSVIPLQIKGLKEAVEFESQDGDAAPILRFKESVWQGVLPASGISLVKWKSKRKAGNGELFYTSESISYVTIGAGLMRTSDRVSVSVLQGKMSKLSFDLQGSGEILAVTGKHIASWKVNEANGKRTLDCVFSSARADIGFIQVTCQHPLGALPAKVMPLSLTPQGTMLHSGFVRLRNEGAVRIGVSKAEGVMQLSPEQFPGTNKKELEAEKALGIQFFAFRYPSAERSIEVTADQIISEIAVNQILVYEMGETDRAIYADIELDIREAGIREWSFKIPADYAVSQVSCASMADHVVSTTVEKGMRSFKILFNKTVIGRQLVQLKLEKNLAAKKGIWKLPRLKFPDVKNIRADIGIQAAHGWRVVPAKVDGLKERALAYFPKRSETLQQAYRVRGDVWNASVKVEEMGQSIQADLFHLYRLKDANLEAKILINYFVIGAPTNSWKVTLPTGAENITVDGQNVRSWDVAEGVLTVHLHQPAMGASTLLISYEQSLNATGGKISLGETTPLNVETESGFIQLVSSDQVKHKVVSQSKSLFSISPLEMPNDLRKFTSLPTIGNWQYATRPTAIQLEIESPELLETVSQVIGAASLNTKITSAGDVVTYAKFLVRTRGKKALRLTLPEGNQLLSAKSDGKRINARVDDKQFILPLPPTKDLIRYRTVEIRYGGTSENPEKVTVGPPVLSAPMSIAEWNISGDNHLEVIGGNVKPLQVSVRKTGFDWMRENLRVFFGVSLLLIGGIYLTRRWKEKGFIQLFGFAWLFAALFLSLMFASKAKDFKVQEFKSFDVVAPVVSQSQAVVLELENSTSGVSTLSTFGVIFMVIGFGVVIAAQLGKLPKFTIPLALILSLLGSLMHVGGGFYFYGIMAGIALFLLVIGIRKIDWDDLKTNRRRRAKSKAPATIVSVLIAIVAMSQQSDAGRIADSISEQWQIKQETLTASATIQWKAEKGDVLDILHAPASLTGNTGEGYRIVKSKEAKTGKISWKMIAEKEGVIQATIQYQMGMKNIADQAWIVPSGKAVSKKIALLLDLENWTVSADQAVMVQRKNVAKQSAMDLTLIGMNSCSLRFKPMPRDRKNETLRFFAEMSDLYLPAPGVLDGRHKIKIRPLSGQIEELSIDVPGSMMVGDVIGGDVDKWTFDAKKKSLTITLKRPQTGEFTLFIMTQRGLKTFPQQVQLTPMKIQGVETVVGMLGYGFGNDAQPDDAKVNGFTEANIADFDGGLIKQAKSLQQSFVLHKAYRYSKVAGTVQLKVAAVSPEIRVRTQQVIRLSDERISLQVEAIANITRAGVFELKFAVPENFNVEGVSGTALRDWSETAVKKQRIVTMYLNGKTIGAQRFVITMLGNASKIDPKKWTVPQWELLDVTRQNGTLFIIPDQGIRLRVLERKSVSQQENKAKNQSLDSLRFRLLQKDWKLTLGIQKLDAWVTAQLLQEVILKESISQKSIKIDYMVEHSVVKSFQLRLPDISSEQAGTVRASGPSVKEIVHIKDDIWQVQMKQAVIGRVPVLVEYQLPAVRKNDQERIAPIHLLNVQQIAHYIAIRAPGSLDMQEDEASRSKAWRRFDWANVPESLQRVSDSSVPSLCYRVSSPKSSINVSVKRHAMAGTLKLRVENGVMKTLLNAKGDTLSRLALNVRVIEESSLRVRLPKGAELFNVIVNDESVAVVKDGDEYSFNVSRAPALTGSREPASEVKITYRNVDEKVSKKIKLQGPSLNIPLEKMDWFIMLPDSYGYEVTNFAGFEKRDVIHHQSKSYLTAYQQRVQSRFQARRAQGQKELNQAMNWSNSGDLDKANAALNRVFQNSAVDAASNEDARVKLERNLSSQALMALNTRRQKLYLDNKAAGNSFKYNGALEQAAKENPYFQGKQKFDPNQLSNYMLGNTPEEINAMQRIAKKISESQLDLNKSTQAIDIEMLETTNVLHFYRDIYLSGDNSPAIELSLNESVAEEKGSNFPFILCLIVAVVLGAFLYQKR